MKLRPTLAVVLKQRIEYLVRPTMPSTEKSGTRPYQISVHESTTGKTTESIILGICYYMVIILSLPVRPKYRKK